MTTFTQLSEQLQQTIFAIVDEKYGLLQNLVEIPLEHSEPHFYIYSAETSDVNYGKNFQVSVPKQTFYASGAGVEREQAMWSCVGEAVERYAAAIADPQQLIDATPTELADQAINLTQFVWFSDEQYLHHTFIHKPSPEQEITWALCCNLHHQSKLYFPAQLIWLDNTVIKSTSASYATQISTGLAAGATLDMAILSGLYEVIERDSFACYWLLQLTPKKLDWRLIPNLKPQVVSLLTFPHTEISLLLLENDFAIPAVLCVQRSFRHEAIAIGMCANIDLSTAVQKAVIESFHTLNWTMDMKRNQLASVLAEEVHDFREHVRFYFSQSRFCELDFLLRGEDAATTIYSADPETAFECPTARIKEVLKRLKARNYEAWFIELTKPELKMLDMTVCRVLIPGLQPLHVGYGLEYRDPKRLQQFCQHMGLHFSGHISQSIHPFP